MTQWRKILVVAGALMVAGCSGNIDPQHLSALYKGMPQQKANEIIANSPVESFNVIVHHQQIHVDVYKYDNTPYFVTYDHQRLLYWGSARKYKNSDSQLVRAVGRRANADWEVMKSS